MMNTNSESASRVSRRNAWGAWLTIGVVVLAVVGFAAMRSRGPAVCPMEVRKVLSKNGTATFQLTNHGSFDVIVHWDANYEIKTREGWKPVSSAAGASYPLSSINLNRHDATSFTGVPLPTLRPGTTWRLRVIVSSEEGWLEYWIRNPRNLWQQLQFRDAQGRFKVGMYGWVYPTVTEATTEEERFEGP